MKQNTFTKTIILVGGGHAHVEVIRQFAMSPIQGVRLILVSEEVETPYSGMVPGLIAGHYVEQECHVSLGPLCTKAGIRLIKSRVVSVDVKNKSIGCRGRPDMPYDLLSINIGSTPNFGNITGAEFTIPIKPIRGFLAQWTELEKRLLEQSGDFNLVVVGGGAAGVEVSLCLHHRLRTLVQSNQSDGLKISICLVTDKSDLLENHSNVVKQKFMRILEANNIRVELNQPITKITKNSVESVNGLKLKSDICVMATHASSSEWLVQTELDLDSQGFIKVDQYLKSVSDPYVFAVGDIAAHEVQLSKNGVHAVRQGPVLAESLRRTIKKQKPVVYAPQKKTLALISTGNKSAIASYGNIALEGAWLWKLKNWIDLRWMERYNNLSMPQSSDHDSEEVMRCGGCGSKVSGVILESVLDQVKAYQPDNLLVGLDSPDDAVVFTVPEGSVVVKTVDQFRSFVDDPYLFGAIAANHALNDIYAMGATPGIAMALVTLPYAENTIIKSEISQVVLGINETLKCCRVGLAGGHTGEGIEMSIGMSITGFAKPQEMLKKSGLRVGDAIVLTRPLGSGALLSAHMKAKIDFETVSKMFASMLRTNEHASAILKSQSASACTDVTGFGLLGHLGEMAVASEVHVELHSASLPIYDGVLDAFSQDIFSTLHIENQAYANKFLADIYSGETGKNTATDIMFDPQTSGGLIAGVESSKAELTIQQLKESGDDSATIIGYVSAGPPGKISII